MATTVRFSKDGLYRVGAQRVYTRAAWDGAWTLQSHLHCLEAAWSCSPSMPTATLAYDYGWIKRENAVQFRKFAKLSGLRRGYVKVEMDVDQNAAGSWRTSRWVGVIELEIDDMLGAIVSASSRPQVHDICGHQTFVAYGLERLLAETRYLTTHFATVAGAEATTAARVAFNSRGRRNRTRADFGGVKLFDSSRAGAEKWSTRDIVKHLLARHSPRNAAGAVSVPFSLAADGPDLPDWDSPEVSTDEATTYSLLSRLIDRRRLFLWWAEYDSTANDVKIRLATMTPQAVPLGFPGSSPIPANSQQVDVVSDDDQLTSSVVRDSDVQRYDVVVCRGADELSVGSFSVADATLVRSWTTTEQTLYDQAATTQPDYPAKPTKVQQRMNADARNAPSLDAVYCRFEIAETWDGRCKNGEGAAATPLFPNPAGGVWDVYMPEASIRLTLPLKKGVDYKDSQINLGVVEPPAADEMEPLVVFKRPDTGTWVRAEDQGQVSGLEHVEEKENLHWSCSVHVRPNSQAIDVRVSGQPQHVIASNVFQPRPVDPPAGGWRYDTGMIATLCLPNGRRVQGQWPMEAPDNHDTVKTLELDAGDHYRRIYVAPGTVVGVSKAGGLIRTFGGYIPQPGQYDHQAQLTAMAKIAHGWYSVEHRVLVIETHRMTTELQIGQLVVRIGDQAVPGGANQLLNSPITEIKISWPKGTAESTPAPTQSITTWAGELDAIRAQPLAADRRAEAARAAMAAPPAAAEASR